MTRTNLESILEGVSKELEAGLLEAEAELAKLDQRRTELTRLIAKARAALGRAAPGLEPALSERARTLHGALQLVLKGRSVPMSARELADEINARQLYVKRNNKPVEPGQIHARISHYRDLFEKDGTKIKLCEIRNSPKRKGKSQ